MPFARFGVRAALAGLALALVAVPFGLLLALVHGRWEPLRALDTGVRDGLHAFVLDHGWFVTVMEAVSAVGAGPMYWIVFGGLAAWLAGRGLGRLSTFVVVTMAGSAVLNRLVKAAVDRSRPVLHEPVAQADGLSFPSGHAQSAAVACLVLLLVFLPVLKEWRRPAALTAAGAYVAVMCLSRVALGVHYLSDVVGGVVLGAAWVAATTALFSAWRRESGLPPVEPEEGLEPEHAGRLC